MRKFLLFSALAITANLSYAADGASAQKSLPNGDVQTTITAPDGTKVLTLQHEDGSSESTSVAPDGNKTTVVEHADGSVDTQMGGEQ